ncbi:MAG: protein kinase [Lachnospiraceae bacterium]|nr:protein kinase [Lachnospiraceae bacterium]
MFEEQKILKEGTVIDGRYEVLRETGRGGMSVVYLIRDFRLRKNWALKAVVKQEQENGEAEENRTRRQSALMEAELLKKLKHPQLPRVVDIIETAEYVGLVMDYIEGRTLEEVIRKEGALPQETVVRWAKQLSGVLYYLHSCDPPVIYRDMKPGNIMLRPDGDVMLFDFGIAREYKPCRAGDTQSLGTFGYAAPEQFGGRGQTTPQTDIYSLGATLYHLLTGKNPADPSYGIRPVREIDPGISAGLEEILLRCTMRDPGKRYRDCAELLWALEHLAAADAMTKKRAKRRMAAFAVPLSAGMLGLAMMCAGIAGRTAQRKNLYTERLTRCSDAAVESVLSGVYRQDLFRDFTKIIDLDPSRPEGYRELLAYCGDMGQTEAGLRAVCVRIDAGAGKIDRNSEVLMQAANLYFSGNRKDSSFSADYARAARYYSEVDRKEYPEAAHLQRIAEALSGMGGGADWEKVVPALESFERYTDGLQESEEKIRQYQTAAGICLAHKQSIAGAGADPCKMAADALRKALLCLDLTEAEDTDSASGAADRENEDRTVLRSALLTDLTSCLLSAEAMGSGVFDREEVLRYCGELLSLPAGQEQKAAIRDKVAGITEMTGDPERIRSLYEKLLEENPEDPSVRLRYSSWLLKEGKKEEAERQYAEIGAEQASEAGPAYAVLGRKIGAEGENG